ncbi:MAG: YqgE/AlgH family protein [Hyphomicrobiales bacterium]|nr:YqgE/AlgH family protein [Hyphomicrobiales bacterium]
MLRLVHLACLSLLLLIAPPPLPAQSPSSLAGQLLIAAPSISDPRFAQTVILMVRHDRNGAFGLVINRPAGEQPLARLLKSMGDKREDGGSEDLGNVQIYAGGPVQPELGFVLHSSDYKLPDTTDIDGRIAMTGNREILRAIAARARDARGTSDAPGPQHSLIAFGYAGWGAGQLEGELARRSWVTAPADPRLVFEEPREKVWEIATARRTQDL